MSQQKLLSVKPKTIHARRLQQLLLDYHDHRIRRAQHPLAQEIDTLGKWQVQRLKNTHAHLYQNPRYREALDFLLEDLYSPRQFMGRDADLERIFPKMVKLLPDHTLGVVANLVELNLLTQKLDEHLTTVFKQRYPQEELTGANYADCFRACGNLPSRKHQLHLINITGLQLEKYVKSRVLKYSLSLTEKPAKMAGLHRLHEFITKGFSAFLAMGGVSELLTQVMATENDLLERLVAGEPDPFAQPNI